MPIIIIYNCTDINLLNFIPVTSKTSTIHTHVFKKHFDAGEAVNGLFKYRSHTLEDVSAGVRCSIARKSLRSHKETPCKSLFLPDPKQAHADEFDSTLAFFDVFFPFTRGSFEDVVSSIRIYLNGSGLNTACKAFSSPRLFGGDALSVNIIIQCIQSTIRCIQTKTAVGRWA
jgi:hypothetical protein